mmetsp:Transcript_41163/g.106567  ORF Transcript_41163/g.106567 Transcript_41163/m.106567 type:complete len:291 (-) Transcript_41163:142-1014(-)
MRARLLRRPHGCGLQHRVRCRDRVARLQGRAGQGAGQPHRRRRPRLARVPLPSVRRRRPRGVRQHHQQPARTRVRHRLLQPGVRRRAVVLHLQRHRPGAVRHAVRAAGHRVRQPGLRGRGRGGVRQRGHLLRTRVQRHRAAQGVQHGVRGRHPVRDLRQRQHPGAQRHRGAGHRGVPAGAVPGEHGRAVRAGPVGQRGRRVRRQRRRALRGRLHRGAVQPGVPELRAAGRARHVLPLRARAGGHVRHRPRRPARAVGPARRRRRPLQRRLPRAAGQRLCRAAPRDRGAAV